MKKNKISTIIGAVAIVTLGFMGCGAFAQSTQTQTDTTTINMVTNQYGTFYAQAKMTNSSGLYWITPPTNTHTGTFKDASGFPAPYASSLLVTRRIDNYSWFSNTNGFTFPATNSSYSLTVYVNTTPPPPTNGQSLTLQVTWQ